MKNIIRGKRRSLGRILIPRHLSSHLAMLYKVIQKLGLFGKNDCGDI